jgi:PAS domain S-box-containing protein
MDSREPIRDAFGQNAQGLPPGLSVDTFLAASPDAVLILDEAGRILHANSAAERVFGRKRSALAGAALESRLPHPSIERFREALAKAVAANENATPGEGVELRSRLLDVDAVAFSLRLARIDDGKSKIVACWIRDLTESLQGHVVADQLSTLIESSDDAIIGTDLTGTVTVWNPAAERLFGYTASEMIENNAADRMIAPVHEEEVDRIAEQLSQGGTVRRFETERLRKDGTLIAVSLSISVVHDGRGRPIGTLAIMHDITARKRAESKLRAARDELERRVEERTANLQEAARRLKKEVAEKQAAQAELRRSERLAAVGTLAAGIAHELNNPLGLITLELHHALAHTGDPIQVRGSLEEIERDAKRCSEIVSSVLRFSRNEASDKCPGDLNESLRKAVRLAAETRGDSDIRIETFLAQPLPRIRMNAAEVEQVLVNLINNAAQASYSGSRIRVSTASDKDGVRLCVRDEGRGMSETQRARACDPFYTTRTHEGGTGLGLSICHGIVAEHGGRIEIESSVGQGTAVTVTFPVPDKAAPAA